MAERYRHGLMLIFPRPKNTVTFKVSPECEALCKEKGVELPQLPSRGLIGLRAACARVAHMSGAAEHDEEFHRDEETTEVMANDGSTAELLNSLLSERGEISVGA
jgi:hypothetical protein